MPTQILAKSTICRPVNFCFSWPALGIGTHFTPPVAPFTIFPSLVGDIQVNQRIIPFIQNIGIRRNRPGNNRFAQAIAGLNNHLISILRDRMDRKGDTGNFRFHHLLDDDRHADAVSVNFFSWR